MRTPLAVLSVTVLLVAGCTGFRPGRDEEEAPESAGTAEWQDCPELPHEVLGDLAPADFIDDLVADVTYECATVPVPQDWDNPDAPERFDIALVRARSDDQRDRIGSLFINPGGPGGSGVDTTVYLSLPSEYGGLPSDVLNRFDVVGFDPRGVGRSSPVECYTDADLDEMFGAEPDPVAQAEFDAQVADTRRVAQACADKYGETLPLFSTRQAAQDIDALRQAVGDEQLTYLGFSYGTLLGAVYAQLYPRNIRAMVLDGAVDAEQDTVESSEAQAQGFERALDNFTAWCGQNPSECPLQPDARAAITQAIDDARSSPVPGGDGRDATAGWVFWAVVSTLYSQEAWPDLGAAIDQLSGGDPTGVFDLADSYAERDSNGEYTNLFDANSAVNCADDDARLSVPQVRDLQSAWREQYPLFGAPLAMSVLTCALWQSGRDPYPTGPAEGAPPIVVVGTLGDPATPYEHTARLADMLGVGVVLTWEGEGHTAYPGPSCIDDAVGAYLVDLEVPAEGTSCPA